MSAGPPVVAGLLLAILGSGLGSGAARAQIETRFDFDNLETLQLNAADCDGPPLAMFLELEVAQSSQAHFLRFVEVDRSRLDACPTDRLEPLATRIRDDEEVTPVGNDLLVRRDEPRSFLMGARSCEGSGRRTNLLICAQIFLFENDIEAVDVLGVVVDVDTTVPPAPTVTAIRGGDRSITVEVERISSAGGDSFSFVVQHRLCGDGKGTGEGEGEAAGEGEGEDGSDVESICGASGAFTETEGSAPAIVVDIGGNNDATVELRVLTVDDFGNRSEATELRTIKLVADLSPLDLYDGGRNELSCNPDSCDESSAAFLAPGLLFMLGRRRRRQQRALTNKGSRRSRQRGTGLPGLLVLLVMSTLSTQALADVAPLTAGERAEERRPWNGLGRTTMSLSIASYQPNIDVDSTFPVYECLFDGATLPRVGGAGDFHVVDAFGSLQLTMGFDITQANGFAQPLNAASLGKCQDPTTTKVQLTLITVRPGLTYRFDPFLDWFSVPLVPYGRVGFVAAGYMFSKDGDVAVADGTENPVGLRYGGEAALGLMLALDFLDVVPFSPTGTTKRARANGVFDHAFLFVEGAYESVDSFGAPGFDLSARDDLLGSGRPISWKAGIAVELL